MNGTKSPRDLTRLWIWWPWPSISTTLPKNSSQRTTSERNPGTLSSNHGNQSNLMGHKNSRNFSTMSSQMTSRKAKQTRCTWQDTAWYQRQSPSTTCWILTTTTFMAVCTGSSWRSPWRTATLWKTIVFISTSTSSQTTSAAYKADAAHLKKAEKLSKNTQICRAQSFWTSTVTARICTTSTSKVGSSIISRSISSTKNHAKIDFLLSENKKNALKNRVTTSMIMMTTIEVLQLLAHVLSSNKNTGTKLTN